MGIFDALTGDAGHQAAAQTRNALGAIVPNLASTGQDAYRQAGDYLQQGYGQARTDLGTGYGAATGAINQGANSAQGYVQQGYAPLSALASQYGQGAGLYADSLGINGPEGNQRAVGAFQAGPGYQFAFDQGTEALNRQANLGGISGNTLRDTFKYGQGLANQEYGNYQNRLAGFNPLQLQATQGAAQGGLAQAGIATGQGQNLSDLARGYYGGLGGLDTQGAGAMAGNAIGGAQNYQGTFERALPQWNNTYKQDAEASESASKNTINLGMNLAKLAAGAAGGMPGLGMGDTFGAGAASGGNNGQPVYLSGNSYGPGQGGFNPGSYYGGGPTNWFQGW